MPRLQVAQDWLEYSSDPLIEAIQRELQTLANADQTTRSRSQVSAEELDKLAVEARPTLENTFALYGWPRFSVLGADACHNFWLLIQHQPLTMQEKMLPAMQAAVITGEASRTDYAYLFDRVQVDQGKAQHWGTQGRCEDNHAILYPVDDPSISKNVEPP